MEETLLLDANWLPHSRVPWQDAIRHYLNGKVEIVESYDRPIRAVTFVIRMPSVARFIEAVRGRKRAVKFSRLNVFTRDQGRCQYCSVRLNQQDATYDHVLPKGQGGKTLWENIVICCLVCNQKKGNRTPAQAGMKLRSVPVKPKKLPEIRIQITWRDGMPDSWRNWLRDFDYWNGELEA